jgi:hypothetical protein
VGHDGFTYNIGGYIIKRARPELNAGDGLRSAIDKARVSDDL